MKNDKPEIKISVVIPVYNAETYISRCIESLKAQTLQELEFIFVDDCSDDQGMGPVKKWADSDPRVRVLRNEHNLGEGGSRNRGIEAAHGIYINTIDPDDQVAENYYELLYAKAVETSADIIKGTRIKIEENTMREISPRSQLNDIIAAGLAKGEPLYLHLHYEHTTIIFKRERLDEHVRYGKSPNAADTTFLLRLCAKGCSYAAENEAYYYYIQRKGTSTAQYSFKRSKNELISLKEQVDYFLTDGTFDEYAYKYCANRFYACSARFIHAIEGEEISPQDKIGYISELKDQIFRIPDYNKLYKTVPELFAVTELDLVPAPRLNTDISICTEEITDWMAFLAAYKKATGKSVNEKLVTLLTSYFHKRKKTGASYGMLKNEIFQIGTGVKGFKQKIDFYIIALKALGKTIQWKKILIKR